MSEIMSKPRVEQVRIEILGADGEWFAPHQPHAALAALRAIGEDIRQYSGAYSDENLRQFQKALRELGDVIARRVGPEAPED